MAMGRPREYTLQEMQEKWQEYKEKCDNNVRRETKLHKGEYVIIEMLSPITYTVKGFTVFLGMTEQSYYSTYADDENFSELVNMIREEVELDARKKFEMGVIPTQLSGLWMGRYGYTTKTETDVKGGVPVVISGENDLED